MSDENDEETDAAGVPEPEEPTSAAGVPGDWAIVQIPGLPTAPQLNQIEADGFEVKAILGPMNTDRGVICQIYVKRVRAIVLPGHGPRLRGV